MISNRTFIILLALSVGGRTATENLTCMIDRTELRKIASERLKDADALLAADRYDGAIYLGGYVVELALKSRICVVLNWKGFPPD